MSTSKGSDMIFPRASGTVAAAITENPLSTSIGGNVSRIISSSSTRRTLRAVNWPVCSESNIHNLRGFDARDILLRRLTAKRQQTPSSFPGKPSARWQKTLGSHRDKIKAALKSLEENGTFFRGGKPRAWQTSSNTFSGASFDLETAWKFGGGSSR